MSSSNQIVTVELNDSGLTAKGGLRPAISSNGRFVLFDDDGLRNMVEGTNLFRGKYVRDLERGITRAVCPKTFQTQFFNHTASAKFSNNGQQLAFVSTIEDSYNRIREEVCGVVNLFTGEETNFLHRINALSKDSPEVQDVLAVSDQGDRILLIKNKSLVIYDILQQIESQISTNSIPAEVEMSTDGKYLTFNYSSENTGTFQVMLLDLQTQERRILTPPEIDCIGYSLSQDRQWIAFDTLDALDMADLNQAADVYAYHVIQNEMELVSRSPSATMIEKSWANPRLWKNCFSRDGRYLNRSNQHWHTQAACKLASFSSLVTARVISGV